MMKVIIAGAGMTRFGRTPGVGLRAMATAAAHEALADAGISAAEIDRTYFGNAAGATVTRQDMVRGQVAFRHDLLSSAPVINIENACASGGSAVLLAVEAVASGAAEVVLAVGVEQLSHVDRGRSAQALRGSMDIEEIGEEDPATSVPGQSALMACYAAEGQAYMEEWGAERSDFARVAVKNRRHAGLNPRAQFSSPLTIDEVVNARMIAEPLTLTMCSPLSDGAAAMIVCSEDYARRHGLGGVRVLASHLAPGRGAGSQPLGDAARKAYATAGLGPADLDLLEVHDAAAPAELIQYEELGLCAAGGAIGLIRDGATELGSKRPVNVSGGLMSRGHPLGATGCAQIFELYEHLRGRAGARQVQGARIGMAANAGGWVAGTYAVGVATILGTM
ncbi:MAG: thiolase family protein [Gemmobacter sp.]|nr:thiolase family protein [Gemmobacter sp.]